MEPITKFTVADLRRALEGLPDDMPVILQGDGEGNSFHWCRGTDPDGVLAGDYGWHADIYSSDWSADDADMDEGEWEALLRNPRVLVLHPFN